MTKYILLLLLSFQIASLSGQEYPSSLTDFLKCLFIDSESGFVFFGSKPVCYYGSGNTHAQLIGTSIHELETKLRVGILLGFGTQNSILGARSETLNELLIATPEIPHADLSMKSPEETLNFLIISLLHENNFKLPKLNTRQADFRFSTVEEEVEYIKDLEEPTNYLLSAYSPRFIFQNYRHQKNNNDLLSTLENQQKNIIELIHADNFTDQVLKQLKITFLNPDPQPEIAELTPMILASELKYTLRNRLFDNLESACEGILDADSGKEDRYTEPDFDTFYELLVLSKLQTSLRANEIHFKDLKQNPDFIEVNEHVYIRILEKNENDQSEVLRNDHSIGRFSYAAYLQTHSEILPIKADSNVTLNLNEAIRGLALGVQGMRTGELREIHIHPDAAYGFIADFQNAEPLKLVVRLENIETNSPELILSRKPIALQRPLILSSNEIDTFDEILKSVSYHAGKSFWEFYKESAPFSGKDLIHQLKKGWNKVEPRVLEESPSYTNLAIYNKRYQREKSKAQEMFKNKSSAISLKDNFLYLRYDQQGHKATPWPKSISLTFKNTDGNILRKIHHENLALKEFERFSQGLQIGLINSLEGDKGTLLIDPDLTDQGLFRNKQARQALIVEFEVHES